MNKLDDRIGGCCSTVRKTVGGPFDGPRPTNNKWL